MTCIISMLDRIPTSAITPLLDSNIPSESVLFLIFETQQTLCERVCLMLKQRGIKTRFTMLPRTENTADLVTFFDDLFEQEILLNDNVDLVFNASSGEPRYLLVAAEVAHYHDVSTFIIEPSLDQLYWLNPLSKDNSNLADKLKVKDYFSVLGYDYVVDNKLHSISLQLFESLYEWLATFIQSPDALRQLNYLAYTAENTLRSCPMDAALLNNRALQTLIESAESHKLLTQQNNRLVFASESSRFFLNGGWLEDLIYTVMLKSKKDSDKLQDVQKSAEVSLKTKGRVLKNELDIVALANNRLHIIECKTKSFSNGNCNEIVYKLDSLAEVMGGTHARMAIISFHPIGAATRARAKHLGISIFEFKQLAQIERLLLEWMKEA